MFPGCFHLLLLVHNRKHPGSTHAKFWTSSSFYKFSFRIFVVLDFEVVWPRRPQRPRKGVREFFQKLHFWNQCIPAKKMSYVLALRSKFFTKSLHRGGVGYVNRKMLELLLNAVKSLIFRLFLYVMHIEFSIVCGTCWVRNLLCQGRIFQKHE